MQSFYSTFLSSFFPVFRHFILRNFVYCPEVAFIKFISMVSSDIKWSFEEIICLSREAALDFLQTPSGWDAQNCM